MAISSSTFYLAPPANISIIYRSAAVSAHSSVVDVTPDDLLPGLYRKYDGRVISSTGGALGSLRGATKSSTSNSFAAYKCSDMKTFGDIYVLLIDLVVAAEDLSYNLRPLDHCLYLCFLYT